MSMCVAAKRRESAAQRISTREFCIFSHAHTLCIIIIIIIYSAVARAVARVVFRVVRCVATMPQSL